MEEILVEIFLVWIVGYPAAFVRWAFYGFKKGKFQKYLETDRHLNFFIFSALVVLIFFLVTYLKHV